MKKALFFAALLLTAFLSKAEVSIDLHVKNGEGQDILVYPVLNGKYFFYARYFQPLDAQGKALIRFSTFRPGFCYLFVQGLEPDLGGWNAVQLFVRPRGQYSVTLDAFSPRESLSIEGGDVKEQRFLNSRDRYFIQYGENPAVRVMSGTYNTLEEVATQTGAEVVLLDVWATWCRPCIAEFPETGALKEYVRVQEGKVAVVYLAHDQEERTEQWRKLIHHYQLEGYHFPLNDQLLDAIATTLGEHGRIGLPIYALLSGNGEVLAPEAARPSDWKALKAQMEAILVKKY